MTLDRPQLELAKGLRIELEVHNHAAPGSIAPVRSRAGHEAICAFDLACSGHPLRVDGSRGSRSACERPERGAEQCDADVLGAFHGRVNG